MARPLYMAYVKHPEHGNKHVPDEDVAALIEQGWVKWPRSVEEKASEAVEQAADTPATVAKRRKGKQQ